MKMRNTFYLALLCLFSFSTMQAAQPFASEHFEQGFPPNWATGDDSGQAIIWEYCQESQHCPPAVFQTEPLSLLCRYDRFESATIDDGFMFVNAYASQGFTTPHQSYLRTGSIDCSSKDKVFLRFNTLLAGGGSIPENDAVVRVRVGTGAWTVFKIFHFLNEDAETNNSWNPQTIHLDLTNVAANKDNVVVEWRWTGLGGYFWAIDDVAFFDENPVYENTVWGQISGQGDFAGGLNGWSVSASNPSDSCRWVWSNAGVIESADNDLEHDAIGCSPTLLNGAAIINASFCARYGSPFNFTWTRLTSPTIDLSAIPIGKRLALQFSQAVSIANRHPNSNLPITSVLVSVDGGANFLDTIDANPLLPYRQSFCGNTTLHLPMACAGSPNVKLTFVFAGDSDFWMVDDVRIVEHWDRDLEISPFFFAIAPNYFTPIELVQPVAFQADVNNLGQEPMDEVSLSAVVKNDLTGAIVFSDTLVLGTLMPGESVQDTFFTNTFLPPSELASYTAYYQVDADQPDEQYSNNVVRWKFEVTPDVFAKDKGECSYNGIFTPGTGDIEYEIGNCYFIPPGTSVKATSVSFAFDLPPPDVTTMPGKNLRLRLYKWATKSSWGDVNNDTLANGDEITEITINTYQIQGDENFYQLIDVPLSVDSPFIELEDSMYYFVTVAYENYPGPEPFFIAASEELNYTSSFWTSYQLGLPNYTSMLRLGNSEDFLANGWGLQRIPVVRLNIDGLDGASEAPPDSAPAIVLFPNPATNTVQVDLNEMWVEGWLTVEILDIWGRLVSTRHYEHTFVSHLPIDVSGLSNGSYILRVVSEKSSASSPLVIQKP